ncbi:MAG TPA: HlyD family type I secretion periplasmic adaptor subunit [Porticoccaceae bacterium]|nr:HlyD family type I secretion periplasmic adaptor subunit [Porticoccaceae bacterium]
MTELTAQADSSGENPLNVDDSRVRYAGLLVVLATFVVFGGWSMIAPLGGAALAPGVVMVNSHRKTVQHLEGGIVRRLLVREGDVVEEGDVLLELDDTLSSAELGIVQGQLITAQSIEARLIAERDNLKEIAYPEGWHEQHADERIRDAIADQNQIFVARTNTKMGERQVLEQRIEQLKAQVAGLEELRKSKRNLVDSYAEEIADIRDLLKDGFADNRRLREFERNHTQNLGDIADLGARIAGLKINIGETRLQILQLEKELQEEVTSQLGEIRSTMFELGEKIDVMSDKARRVAVVAPVSGMVIDLAVHTEGGVIGGGSPVMDIVPLGENLVIEAQVSPMDIDRVSVGMEAEVRFSAFKRGKTPILIGRVVTLSADRLVNEQDGSSYYLARIELTEESAAAMAEIELLPGMPAEVLIKTAERTLFRYIFQPFTDMFARSFTEE